MSFYDFKGEPAALSPFDFRTVMGEKEREILELMIAQAGTTDKNTLATILGLSRPTLYRLLKKHNLTVKRVGAP